MSGRFVTLEGGEGAGKSTQARLLADWLRDKEIETVLTREPGGTPAGDAIRAMLMDRTLPLTPMTETLLFAAARAEHVDRLIRPALERGEWVVCDRFLDSSLAYQGGGHGLGIEQVTAINASALGGLAPDLTLYLRADSWTGRERALKRDGTEADRFAVKDKEFHHLVAKSFDTLATAEPNRIEVIDARADIDAVAASIRAAVERRLM